MGVVVIAKSVQFWMDPAATGERPVKKANYIRLFIMPAIEFVAGVKRTFLSGFIRRVSVKHFAMTETLPSWPALALRVLRGGILVTWRLLRCYFLPHGGIPPRW